MLRTHRIKILHSEYIEKSDLIRWDVLFFDDSVEQSYVWPSVDLLSSLNIKGKVDPSVLHKFCDDVKGKTINLVVDKDVKTPDVSITQEQYNKINDKLAEHFDTFQKVNQGD